MPTMRFEVYRAFLWAALVLLLVCAVSGCRDDTIVAPTEIAADGGTPVEATSLLGEPLRRPEPEADVAERQEELLAAARARLDAAPDEFDAWVWVGRRQAYLGRYREAIATYTEGLDRLGPEPHLLRHRGHRYLTVRRLQLAIGDLQTAAEKVAGLPDEVEADGLPNALNVPTSTLGTNIHYHLGLGHYLRRDLAAARAAYQACLELSTNDDMRAATLYWLYLSERRAGRHQVAQALLDPVAGIAEMDIIENHAYHRLLLLFEGPADSAATAAAMLDEARAAGASAFATTGYGVAAWRWLQGDEAGALELWQEIVDAGAWPSFGTLAAEAALSHA